MANDEWKAAFLNWYSSTSRVCIESKDSMKMLDELQNKFRQAPVHEKRWMLEVMQEWSNTGDEYQRYDSQVLVPQFHAELDGA